jgi:hypothetical protein
MANEEMILGLHRHQWPVASGGTSAMRESQYSTSR